MRVSLCVALLAACFSAVCAAAALPDRVAPPIDGNQTVILPGHIPPRAQAQYDQGRVEPSFKLGYMTMMFKPSAEQQAALTQLLADQQDPNSPHYHQWLTPEQYAARFGMSRKDLRTVSTWLRSQGFGVLQVARGGNWIAFRGTADQVERAFHTEIHRYKVNGEEHFANASNPSVPKALGDVVQGFRGLNNFGLRPMGLKELSLGGKMLPVIFHHQYTAGGQHFLSPDDIATIYDIKPLYTAGYNGTGQKLVIVGQTDIYTVDIDQFRAGFGLAKNDPTQILAATCSDPGVTGDLVEADLDLEWSGAIARNATVIYVKCDTNTHDGVLTSAQYAIDNDLAPVISMSYGLCESDTGSSFISIMEGELQKANAEGITFMASSGDTGAAACDYGNNVASHGFAVNYPASSPEVTGVGGNEFDEGGGNYWSSGNSSTYESALSYIPEIAWNDSAQDNSLVASGGGASSCALAGCKGFAKPTWQTGQGVPNDKVRDVPDIALTASADHDGYILCTNNGSCASGIPADVQNGNIYGGTSASSPVFAGIVVLLNQYLGNKPPAGLGNINPMLYQYVASNSSAFHDVTTGNNKVPCTPSTPNCPSSPPYQFGYNAGVGYDQVTGLGSVDTYNFVSGWNGTGGKTATTTTLTLVPAVVNVGANVNVKLTATVKRNSGSGTPTGTVTFYNGTTQIGTPQNLANGSASVNYNTGSLAANTYQMTATYSGDTNFAGSNGLATLNVEDFSLSALPTTVTVSSPGLTGTTIVTVTPLGGFNQGLSYSCSGLPAESTCTFTALSSTSETLDISTTAASELRNPFGRSPIFYALFLPGLMGFVIPGGIRKRSWRLLMLLCLVALLAGSTLWMPGCGGGSTPSNPGTPTGNSAVTITATTAGTNPLQHTTKITLSVQ